MSLEVWPHLPFAELQKELQATEKRELDWQLDELRETLTNLKQSLEDCYKLLGPDGNGNTLVVSTPRNEAVKGHITRLGTQIVRGSMHIRLRTLPHQTLTIDPRQPITIGPLAALHTLLTRSIDLLALTLAYSYPPPRSPPGEPGTLPLHGRNDTFISTQLRVLAQALTDALALLKGPAPTPGDPAWSTRSVSLSHFSPALPSAVSFYIGLQDSQLVLWLRAVEPVGVPLNFGMKFALALGTARRIEHDEADKVFTYSCEDGTAKGLHSPQPAGSATSDVDEPRPEGPAEVYVREKVRIESADPSLMSLSAKLGALNHALLLVRRNLAAVMGEELED
ncbi:37S ribosomal protein rsm22 [Grosmannia clavigera kw1407]|uniref:37S ribosomal protein rsm22 n=1 Tax=Grosmannia clavigera (strain kw1407 / UAMH 11150) TaxID=655863 RepID=F0XKC2_GROCL|nr:37S ribosomal protein rsm22 [Grosmannia clavigera kw1407]EFX01965.1 37S ribosomal protein rsm22 [Grosmannia clavigera kw1407]